MEILAILLAAFVINLCICYLWVYGIDKMNREHPDYKGEDLFNEDINNLI